MKIYRFLLLILVIVWQGCQEAEQLMFRDITRVQMDEKEEILYGFFYMDRNTVTRDTVYLTVNTMGGPENRLRRIALKQIPEYDITYKYDNKGNLIDSVVTEKGNKAVPGVHYVGMDDPEMESLLVVKPNAVTVEVPVILLRDTSLRTEEYRLCLQLVETSDFQLGENEHLSGKIVFSDKLSKPSEWAVYDKLLGKYSTRKHEFMYEVAGEKIDNEWFKRFNNDLFEFTFFQNKFKNALAAYNADPENIARGWAPMREDQRDPSSALVVFP